MMVLLWKEAVNKFRAIYTPILNRQISQFLNSRRLLPAGIQK
jgi:hypothetical protein